MQRKSSIHFAPVTNIDARGSTMSEGQFQAILDRNNRQLLRAVPAYLEQKNARSFA